MERDKSSEQRLPGYLRPTAASAAHLKGRVSDRSVDALGDVQLRRDDGRKSVVHRMGQVQQHKPLATSGAAQQSLSRTSGVHSHSNAQPKRRISAAGDISATRIISQQRRSLQPFAAQTPEVSMPVQPAPAAQVPTRTPAPAAAVASCASTACHSDMQTTPKTAQHIVGSQASVKEQVATDTPARQAAAAGRDAHGNSNKACPTGGSISAAGAASAAKGTPNPNQPAAKCGVFGRWGTPSAFSAIAAASRQRRQGTQQPQSPQQQRSEGGKAPAPLLGTVRVLATPDAAKGSGHGGLVAYDPVTPSVTPAATHHAAAGPSPLVPYGATPGAATPSAATTPSQQRGLEGATMPGSVRPAHATPVAAGDGGTAAASASKRQSRARWSTRGAATPTQQPHKVVQQQQQDEQHQQQLRLGVGQIVRAASPSSGKPQPPSTSPVHPAKRTMSAAVSSPTAAAAFGSPHEVLPASPAQQQQQRQQVFSPPNRTLTPGSAPESISRWFVASPISPGAPFPLEGGSPATDPAAAPQSRHISSKGCTVPAGRPQWQPPSAFGRSSGSGARSLFGSDSPAPRWMAPSPASSVKRRLSPMAAAATRSAERGASSMFRRWSTGSALAPGGSKGLAPGAAGGTPGSAARCKARPASASCVPSGAVQGMAVRGRELGAAGGAIGSLMRHLLWDEDNESERDSVSLAGGAGAVVDSGATPQSAAAEKADTPAAAQADAPAAATGAPVTASADTTSALAAAAAAGDRSVSSSLGNISTPGGDVEATPQAAHAPADRDVGDVAATPSAATPAAALPRPSAAVGTPSLGMTGEAFFTPCNWGPEPGASPASGIGTSLAGGTPYFTPYQEGMLASEGAEGCSEAGTGSNETSPGGNGLSG